MEALKTRKRILVLDKDTRLLNALDELLASGEWDVYTTFDQNAVYDMAKRYKPDLVILDYLLIDQDCELICQDFKTDLTLQSIPIIIVTAYKSKRINEEAFKCDALFVKPLDFRVLSSRMDHLMAS
ncbi:MAG: response regulator [Janthinobacterium lividum]